MQEIQKIHSKEKELDSLHEVFQPASGHPDSYLCRTMNQNPEIIETRRHLLSSEFCYFLY